MQIHFRAVIFFVVLNCAALAQNQINGPDLNFLFDPSARAIRRIVGMPGAAHLGPALRPEFAIASLAFSATGKYALAVRETDRQLFLVSLASREPAYSAIDGLSSSSGRVFVSPGGGAAAVCGDDCRTITRVAGLPQSPSIAGAVIFDRADTLAIADSGAILAAAADDSGSSLLYAGTDGSTRVIGHAGRIAALAVFADGSAAVFADATANTLVRIDDLPGAAPFSTIAGADQGVSDPVGVAVSRSSRLAFVAMQSYVVAVDLKSTAPAARFDCACAITAVENLAGDAVLRLTAANAPLWLFDADSSQPRFVFVPAAAKARRPEAIR